jgi:peptidoglycan/LPS O-acetylase OafA/YrhL
MIKTEKFHSATISDSKLLQGILGLRGIAASAVVLTHICFFTGIKVPEGFHFIERDFGYGAQLFFVLSAFSLMYSTEHTTHRPDWVREYLIKRFFRIAPLFYIMLVVMLTLLASLAFQSLPSISIIFLNVFFMFGFFQDPTIGVVWAGWTIGVEMIFYVLFPVLLMLIKTKNEALIFMLLAVLISYVSGVELHSQYLNAVPRTKMDWSYYTFLPNLYFFAVGIYAYRFEQTLVKSSKTLHVVIPLAATITIGVMLFTEVGKPLRNAGELDLFIWAFGFGALCVWQRAKPSFWSANKYLEYLGERSFSIYLLHPLIIYFSKSYIVSLYSKLEPSVGAYAFFVCAFVVMVEVLIMAEITYRAIEVPGIKLGRKVIGAMRGVSPPV